MRKKNKMNSLGCRVAAMALAVVMGVSLAGCGSEEEAPGKEWAYVPEFVSLEEEEVFYYDMQLVGDSLYYVSYVFDEEEGVSRQSICRFSVTDETMTSVELAWPEDMTGGRGISSFRIGSDGSVYITNSSYDEALGSSKSYLHKFDKDGKYVFGIEPKDPDQEEAGAFWVQDITVDDQGRIYLSGGSRNVLLFDAEGKSCGTLSPGTGETWVESVRQGSDGKVLVVYTSYDGSSSSTAVAEADFDGRKLGTVYGTFPSNVRDFSVGAENRMLLNDRSKVYEYDLETQEKTELFDWLDCDINGNCVETFGQLEDGRFVAVVRDWDTSENEVVLLTRVKASEVVQKENITIGTLSGGYALRSLAVRFNKASDKYHVSVKEYLSYDNLNENSYTDAITSLNNDITSSNCPDIIDLSGVNVSQLASRGAFEDLNDYLERSSVLNRSDFLENILSGYTYNDILVSIPSSFTLQTVVGHKSQLGDKKGWTLEEMIAYADANPNKELFDGVEKWQILQGLIMLNEETFMDRNTGECNFDSDGFKSLLEFVNRFPDQTERTEDTPVTPIRIQNGEVLLDMVSINEFNSIQESLDVFGDDAVCIGYPTVDGSSGHAFNGIDAYAIASRAKCKEGAWEFIESILAGEDSRYSRGFPSLKSKLDAMAEEAVKIEYVLDENNEPYLDENGEPIIANSGGGIGWGDWFFEYHVPTQEEVDMVLEVMKEARPVNYNGAGEVLSIIQEEAEPFFQGQKSVDEVAGIIQNRVKIYIDENR